MRGARSALAAGLILAASCAPAMRREPEARPIRFLLVNDVYIGDTARSGDGGLARVATVKNELEKDGPVLFVLAGDFLSPSLLSKWYSGRQMVEMFNAARLDYATFGNHEFELVEDSLDRRIADSKFRWTSANCGRASGGPFINVSEWDTVTVEGTRVGIFGLTLQGQYRSYVRCTNPDSATAVAVARLKNAGAQLIVGITHLSRASDSTLLARYPAIDLILGGHEHSRQEVNIGGRMVLKADGNATSAQFVSVARGSSGWKQDHRLIPIDRTVAAEPVTKAVVQRWQDSLRKRVGPETIIGRTTVPLEGRSEVMRYGEASLGSLVTDAFRAGTGADVALVNTGTLRLDDVVAPGIVTNYTIRSIFLFADDAPVVVFPLTGARLRAIIEHGLSIPGNGRFPNVSGIRFTWNAGNPAGTRIVGDIRRDDGRVITASDTLRVAFVSYPACEGGDRYTVPEASQACRTVDSAPRGPDLLIEHISKRLGGVVNEPSGPRMRKVTDSK